MQTPEKKTYILAIESSCDDSSAAVLCNDVVLSNVIANQKVHEKYGGVVPELASRAHQENIIPVVDTAIKEAGIRKEDLDAVAFTRGPGLLGSLLVGVSFAKAFALALGIPLIDVDHLHAHILAHFIQEKGSRKPVPRFPFLCLTVSGGHTQIIRMDSPADYKITGTTIDDAAGETFDKAAKIMGLPYPGGPVIDGLAKEGKPVFLLPKPKAPGLNFSFSGLKTAFLYLIRDELKKDPDFIEKNKKDLAASIQKTIIDMLIQKLKQAAKQEGITEIAIAGGVSANSGLRKTLLETAKEENWNVYIPPVRFTTDNAAMIGMAGYIKYQKGEFVSQDIIPYTRYQSQKTKSL